MSLSSFAVAQAAIAEARGLSQPPKRAPGKRTVVVQPDRAAAPEAR